MMRRVIEGEKEELASDEEEESEDEEEELRKRSVFLLKGGLLKVLENGVRGFEESLERRVEKLLASKND